METMLNRLFDFQAFTREPALQEAIDSVHRRYEARELSLDEMEWVAAAGIPETKPEDKENKGN